MDQISVFLPGILLAYTTFLVAIASPGPNVLAIIGTDRTILWFLLHWRSWSPVSPRR